MRYWLCCDGGGTKLIMLLVDEELQIVRTAAAGGVNPNFLSVEHIRRNMDDCIRAVMEAGPVAVEACYVSMPSPIALLKEALEARGIHTALHFIGEGEMGLLAGLGGREGFAALSGTGSDVFYVNSGAIKTVGGWGLLLGDEGSGSQIGQKGMIAAIHAIDGRGPSTLLEEKLLAWLGSEPGINAREVFSRLTGRVYSAASPRAELASFVPFAAQAERMGDPQAIALFEGAGRDMGNQMNALLRQVLREDPSALSLPSTLCGGVWKAARRMYRSYRATVLAAFPQFVIRWPRFDAVAGGAVLVGLSLGRTDKEIRARMEETFHAYLYQKE